MDVDSLFDKLKNAGPNCKSLLKKYLTQPVFDKLKKKTTDYGGTLAHCIRSGKKLAEVSDIFRRENVPAWSTGA